MKSEERAKDATFQAWQTARFYLQGRSKKGLPSLKHAMNEVGQPQVAVQQSPAVMKAMLNLIGIKEQRI